jgi:hypothetical protein
MSYKTSVEPFIHRLAKEWDCVGEPKIKLRRGEKFKVQRTPKEKELIAKYRKGLIWKNI